MEIAFRHWVMGAALGCGCLAVALLPPRPRPTQERYPTPDIELRERYHVSSRLREAELELREARLVLAIDSVLPGSAPRSDIPRILPVGPASPAERDSFAAQVARVWPSGLVGVDSLPLLLVLQGDRNQPEWRSTYLLPGRGEAACVTVVKTEVWTEKTGNAELLTALMREMGPCLFYWTYGKPGQSIGQWIRGYGLPLATRFDLARTPTEQIDQENTQNEILWILYVTTGEVRRCLRGDRAECAKSIVGPAVLEPSTEPRALAKPEWYYRLPLGSGSSAWLSDLQQAMGASRFSRFWHSSQPVEPAFQDAFGVELGEWTHGWIEESFPGMVTGPLPHGRSVAYASGIMLLLVGLVAVVAKRRTVG